MTAKAITIGFFLNDFYQLRHHYPLPQNPMPSQLKDLSSDQSDEIPM
jgi:hypothetical protein